MKGIRYGTAIVGLPFFVLWFISKETVKFLYMLFIDPLVLGVIYLADGRDAAEEHSRKSASWWLK